MLWKRSHWRLEVSGVGLEGSVRATTLGDRVLSFRRPRVGPEGVWEWMVTSGLLGVKEESVRIRELIIACVVGIF